MTIDQNIEIIKQIADHQRAICSLRDQLMSEDAKVMPCSTGGISIHIYSGIDVLAKALGCSVDIGFYDVIGGYEMLYPYKVSFCCDGIDYYQMMAEDEYKTFAANSAAQLNVEVSA